MANPAQLLRRQSSRDFVLKTQRSIDQLELRVNNLLNKIISKGCLKINYSIQELRGRLVTQQSTSSADSQRGPLHHGTSVHMHQHQLSKVYGATNQGFMADAFDEASEFEVEQKNEKALVNLMTAIKQSSADANDSGAGIEAEKENDERESWDSKIMFLLATIG